MRKYNLIISAKAKKDLLNINDYISKTLKGSATALNLIKEIEKSIRDLDYMPERFRIYKGLDGENLRICPVKSYLIFYRVNSDKKLVEIIRILYSKRDYEDII